MTERAGLPLISVIVPVYRTEKYLRRCVDSILSQTYQNLEILLVDDGSPDGCGALCDAMAREDSRIRVLHKENGGLSSARNAGLDAMTGTYVGFVDSDDWIEPEMYEILLRILLTNRAGMAACTMSVEHRNGRVSYSDSGSRTQERILVLSAEAALSELTAHEKITNSLCDKLFCAFVFRTLRMTEGTVNEDFEIMPRCIRRAGTVCCILRPMYHYVMTESSIMRGSFKPSRFTEADMSRKRIMYYAEHYPQLRDYAAAGHAEVCLNLIFFSAGVPACEKQRELLIRELPRTVTKAVFLLMNRRNKLKFILCRLSPKLYSTLMGLWYGERRIK